MQYDPTNSRLKIGDKAPYFSLPATDGKIYSISDFAHIQALVVIFTSNHCPYAQAYEERISTLAKEFADKSVQIICIGSNDATLYPEESFEQMVKKSKMYDFSHLYLQDATQNVAKSYSAVVTPEVFLFNQDLELCYHGEIDDNYADSSQVSKRFLAQGINDVLNARQPNPAITRITRCCSIKFRN